MEALEMANTNIDVSNKNSIENLTIELREVRKLLCDEQSSTCQLKRQLYESESKRLELVSLSNQETFELKSDLARLRKELEKSEALRQTLESELATLKSCLMKEKLLSQEKDKSIREFNRLLEERSKKISEIECTLQTKLDRFTSTEEENSCLKQSQSQLQKKVDHLNGEIKISEDTIEALRKELKSNSEKSECIRIDHMKSLERIKTLEEHFSKQKLLFDSEKLKNAQLRSTIKELEDKRIETELNFENLNITLKEKHGEIVQEQIKSRSQMERFKKIETELKRKNLELLSRLEPAEKKKQDRTRVTTKKIG